MCKKIRAPILTTLGHVDHGKTTLLDCIRGTIVAKKEPGQITQLIGCSFIPADVIEKVSKKLLEKFKIKLTIPGLLIIDTPGHEAFTALRKRGGAVSDLAVLVIDVNEGFQPQTDESLTFLREFKTPFIVAATKIDKTAGWFPYANKSFLESFQKQREDVKDDLDKKIYQLISQLAERGFDAERFDRVEDFTKRVAIVPTSGLTGEGVPELLMVLTGLTQQFLKKRLEVSAQGKGTVLEVKDVIGLGTTIDVILYDGSMRKGDYIVIGGREPIETKIRALLRPRPLRELRIEKQFESVDEVHAAAGVKIAALGLESVIAGSPIIVAKDEREIEAARKAVQKEVEEVEFTKDVEGVIIKSDTLGSLEAMIKMVREHDIPIKKAEVGHVTKQDIVELQSLKDDLKKVVLAFNVKVLDEADVLARGLKIKIFHSNIIYKLLEDYEEWRLQKKERELQEKLEKLIWPAKMQLIAGAVFRQSKPAVFGVDIISGKIKAGYPMIRKDGKLIGKIKEIQKEGKTIAEAKVEIKLPFLWKI